VPELRSVLSGTPLALIGQFHLWVDLIDGARAPACFDVLDVEPVVIHQDVERGVQSSEGPAGIFPAGFCLEKCSDDADIRGGTLQRAEGLKENNSPSTAVWLEE